MSKSFREDLTGKRFGRLTVIEFVPNEKPVSYWRCKCDCGNAIITQMGHLKTGHSSSCGCLKKEKIYLAHFTHGKSKTRLHKIWDAMKARCSNPNLNAYKNYGGRGITVCDEWRDNFKAFYDWAMANGYTDDLTIDRIDTNGNYEPSNCRWVDRIVQSRNTRRNTFVKYQGRKMCLSEAGENVGINANTIKTRYRRGDRGEKLFRPVKNK